jgi:26S proteasome regulatory subunit N1
MKLSDKKLIVDTLHSSKNELSKMQLCFMLARHRVYVEELPDNLKSIVSNLKTSEFFKKLGRELDVLEPKLPEDIFKSHLEEKKSEQLDSYKLNLASSIVSSFVNAGFCTEKLLADQKTNWFSRNKEEGLICTLAGLGLVNLWDIDSGPNELEKYMGNNEKDPYIISGYLLGISIISSGVRDENEIARAILSERINEKEYSFINLVLSLN